MKSVKLVTALVGVFAIISNAADAQQVRYPISIQPMSFEYFEAAVQSVSTGVDSDVASCACDETTNGAAPSVTCDAGPSCGTSCGLGGCGCSLLSGNWCCLGEPFRLACDDSCIKVGGWWATGYSANEQPFSDSKGEALSFNDSTGNIDLHQAVIYFGKEAENDGCCWDWGFRFDMMYGTDSQKTQAFANTDGIDNPRGFDNDWDHGRYGWAIPQLYGEVAVGKLSVIFGHFYKIAGYEVVPSPDNFFFSHSFTMFNAEPFTHTGALATYSANDNLTFYAGYTLGWDTGFDQFSSGTTRDNAYTTNDGSNFLGGFSITNCCKTATFTYITTWGDFGWRGSDGYAHSMVLDLTLTDKINYVVQSDFVSTNQFNEDTVGINQYLFYRVNDCLGAGMRFEWFKDDAFGANFGTVNDDVYELTYGVNFKPHANLVVRPEVRHNWEFDNGHDEDITVFGIDTVFTF